MSSSRQFPSPTTGTSGEAESRIRERAEARFRRMESHRTGALQMATVIGLLRESRRPSPTHEGIVNLNPYAIRRPSGRWVAVREVSPRTEDQRTGLRLLLTGYLDTPTPTKTEIEAALTKEATGRKPVDTSPGVQPISTRPSGPQQRLFSRDDRSA